MHTETFSNHWNKVKVLLSQNGFTCLPLLQLIISNPMTHPNQSTHRYWPPLTKIDLLICIHVHIYSQKLLIAQHLQILPKKKKKKKQAVFLGNQNSNMKTINYMKREENVYEKKMKICVHYSSFALFISTVASGN